MNSLALYFYNIIRNFIPETRGFGIKRLILRLCGANIAKGARICSSVRILGSGSLTIGHNTWVGHESIIISSSNIIIGADVDIAPRVYIGTGSHKINTNSIKAAGEGVSADIHIGSGSWLCANSTILPGVSIGESVIVGACALVNANIESKCIVAGIPAKIIKKI